MKDPEFAAGRALRSCGGYRNDKIYFCPVKFEDWPDEWKEWVALTPIERFRESEKIFAQYLALGGTLDPEPDPASPFYIPETSGIGILTNDAASSFYAAAQFGGCSGMGIPTSGVDLEPSLADQGG